MGKQRERWAVDARAQAIVHRSHREGEAKEWIKAVTPELRTDGAITALAGSLAGPLVHFADTGSFGLHFCGMSSSGKTTITKLAASIWGPLKSMFLTWNTTSKALEAMAERANCAALVLDDVSKIDGNTVEKRGANLAKSIHTICSDNGRTRLTQESELRSQRNWELVILSSGEMKTKTMIGDDYQGGHRVRMLDLWNEEDNSFTVSAKHAERIERIAKKYYGSVSDMWIEYLVDRDLATEVPERMEKWREKLREEGDSKEDHRIKKNLSLIMTSAEMARDAGILRISEEQIDSMREYLMKCTRDEEGEAGDRKKEATPNERATKELSTTFDTDQARFPDSLDLGKSRNVIGVKVGGDLDGYEIYTNRKMLERSKIAQKSAVGVFQWMKWMVDNGLARRDRKRIGGRLQRWFIISLDALEELN